jgi:hypothetical protein
MAKIPKIDQSPYTSGTYKSEKKSGGGGGVTWNPWIYRDLGRVSIPWLPVTSTMNPVLYKGPVTMSHSGILTHDIRISRFMYVGCHSNRCVTWDLCLVENHYAKDIILRWVTLLIYNNMVNLHNVCHTYIRNACPFSLVLDDAENGHLLAHPTNGESEIFKSGIQSQSHANITTLKDLKGHNHRFR